MMGAMTEIAPTLIQNLLATYQDLHRHPELSMQEHRTAGIVGERLTELGFETRQVGGTGVVGWLVNGDGPTLAFRADMDGLPIVEDTGLDYASTATGTLPDGTTTAVMHACGHDIHTTCGLGIASHLTAHRDQWQGTVVMIFQPAEETGAGAKAMVADGLWEVAPRPRAIFGQHVTSARVGSVDLTPGPAMAMADSWQVTVHGRGGHGSRPEAALNPVLLAAHMVVRLQSVVANEVSARDVSVVTVATFHGGTKENVIPDQATFTLNMRHHDQAVRDRVTTAVRRVLSAEAAASDAPEPTIEVLSTFPLTVNDPVQADQVRAALSKEFGANAVTSAPTRMGSEDFTVLATAIGVPSTFWYIGALPAEVVDADGPNPSTHSPFFAPDAEPTITNGVRAGVSVLLSRFG